MFTSNAQRDFSETSERPGLLCLEGEWGPEYDENLTVEPVLQLLESLGHLFYIHRDVASLEGLMHHLDRLQKPEYAKIRVLYLAAHGGAGSVVFGDDDLTLDELGEILRGALHSRILYIGACASLKASDTALKKLAKTTGAKAVIGYRKNVGWLDSAAFEVALLDELVSSVKIPALIKRLELKHEYITKTLGLVVATPTNVHKTALRKHSKLLDG